MIRYTLFHLLFAVISVTVLAQQNNLPLNRHFLLETEKHLAHPENNFHTAVKPYVESFIRYDSILEKEKEIQKQREFTSGFLRKLKYESLIDVNTEDFILQIDPLFDFTLNRDRADQSIRADTTNFYTNTRGVRARGSVARKFSFETTFLETQSFFADYLNQYVRQWNVAPGQGRVKDFKVTGFDYAIASGYVSFTPVKNLNLQFGHGKHFIGEGYRSLLLSDNAFNYPYLRSQLNLLQNKIQYTTIFSSLQTLRRMPSVQLREELFVRKAGTFHYLGINPHPHLQLGLFEGIIWKTSENSYPHPVSPAFFNPLIGINSIVFRNDEHNHVVNGLNAKLKVLKKAFVYGQYAFSRLNFSRSGYQAGFRWFDFLGITNLHLQAEYNHASPEIYAFSNPVQNFSHYNQPLAHPMGDAFTEMAGFLNYRLRDFFVEMRYSNAVQQYNEVPLVEGSRIAPPRGSVPDDSDKKISWQEARLGYVINRRSNMNIAAGIANRNETFRGIQHSTRIYFITFRTSLFNWYWDF
jgi:hypothetical protein